MRWPKPSSIVCLVSSSMSLPAIAMYVRLLFVGPVTPTVYFPATVYPKHEDSLHFVGQFNAFGWKFVREHGKDSPFYT